MGLKSKSWEDYHHQIYRIYHGIIALSLVPFFLLFLELELAKITEPRIPQVWVIVVLVLLIPACVYVSWMVWKSSVFKYRDAVDLKEKLAEFKRVEINRFLVLEGVCVLALTGLWLTAHYLFIIMYFAVLVQFSFLRPSEDRIIRVMRLTSDERKQLHEDWT